MAPKRIPGIAGAGAAKAGGGAAKARAKRAAKGRPVSWGFAIEHEYIASVPWSADVGAAAAGRAAGAAAGRAAAKGRQMASGKGAYPRFSRRTKWVPHELPSLLVTYFDVKGSPLPMNVELDANGLPALELITRDPMSRTVGALVEELRLSLRGVDAAAASVDFLEFAKAYRKDSAEVAEKIEKSERVRGRVRAAALRRHRADDAALADAVAAAETLRSAARANRTPAPLLCEHGADVATTVYPFTYSEGGSARSGRAGDVPVYTGSLHVNVTLPHAAGQSDERGSDFARRHERAAMCLQWLEPLLVAVLGSPHPFHSVDARVFPALSFRHTSERYTGMVTNDVTDGLKGLRIVETLRGRFVGLPRDDVDLASGRDSTASGRGSTASGRGATGRDDASGRDGAEGPGPLPEWELSQDVGSTGDRLVDRMASSAREGLRWMKQGPQRNEVPWVKLMKEDSSGAANSFVSKSYSECPCVPKLGSDYRREVEARVGLFGFEFRALDRVPPDCLADLLRIVWYAFDASADERLPIATASDRALSGARYNAVKSDAFVPFLVACARQGSAARLTEAYAAALSRVLGTELTGREGAHEALQAVGQQLFERYGGGEGEYSRHVDYTEDGQRYGSAPSLPDLNALAMAYHAALNSGAAREKKKANKKKKPLNPKKPT